MMSRRRAWLLVGTVLALGCALAAVLAAVVPTRPVEAGAAAEGSGPLAVVLVPGMRGSELVVVDLDQPKVVRRVALRSLATDIAADASSGRVVGAQTGGIADDADDALSIVEPRNGQVRYVTLPRTDPSQVRCISGRAVVLHSWVDEAGFVVSAVDVASGSIVATGHAPNGSGMWAVAGGSVWTARMASGARSTSLARLDPVTLAPTFVEVPMVPSSVVTLGNRVAVIGSPLPGEAGAARVVALDPKSGTVIASATVLGLPHGGQLAAVVGDDLVLGDWNGEAPESDVLAVLDGRTLAAVARIHVGAAPCAIAGYGGRLLVVDRVQGVLRGVDPRTGRVDWSVDLGVRELVCSKVVVVGRGSAAAYPPDGANTGISR